MHFPGIHARLDKFELFHFLEEQRNLVFAFADDEVEVVLGDSLLRDEQVKQQGFNFLLAVIYLVGLAISCLSKKA